MSLNDDSTPSEITIDPADAPLGDTTVGATDAADAEFEGRPVGDDASGDDNLHPETQGDDPIIAELGEDGEGDLAPEDV
ncbi:MULTISPECIES: hypothetical protein [unclassified Microbacterium]|uniref:hypothetical protein n=1 Tax=unclassified Microbacterium TaxID=2609290 RepID=UPI00386D7E0D